MTKKRWKFGSYELKINPKSDSQNMTDTSDINMTANGTISATNYYYDRQRSFSLDIYDKPTKISRNPVKTFSNRYYISISESRVLERLYCLRGNNTIDVLGKDGAIIRSIAVNLVSGQTAKCLTHMDDRIAILYTDGTVVICNDNGASISSNKYTDSDILDSNSIAYNFSNSLFLLNKFGKVFKINTANWEIDLVYQSTDFDSNKYSQLDSYRAINIIDYEYVGFLNKNRFMFLNSDFQVVHSTDIGGGEVLDISFGSYSRDFCMITPTKISKISLNMCGIDIDKIKKNLASGIVYLEDDNGSVRYFAVSGMSVKRERNLQDSKYTIDINGQII